METASVRPLDLPQGAQQIISRGEVEAGFDQLAQQLQPIVDAGNCILLGILNGGAYPLMRLADRLRGDFLIDFCRVSRYVHNSPGEKLHWFQQPSVDMQDKTVLVIDDIYDEGITLDEVLGFCGDRGAGQAYSVVQVVKSHNKRRSSRPPDFSTGLLVPDRYVFGCGMDMDGRWRHLQAIYAMPDGN